MDAQHFSIFFIMVIFIMEIIVVIVEGQVCHWHRAPVDSLCIAYCCSAMHHLQHLQLPAAAATQHSMAFASPQQLHSRRKTFRSGRRSRRSKCGAHGKTQAVSVIILGGGNTLAYTLNTRCCTYTLHFRMVLKDMSQHMLTLSRISQEHRVARGTDQEGGRTCPAPSRYRRLPRQHRDGCHPDRHTGGCVRG